MNSKLSYAIAVILGGSSAGMAHAAAPASDTDTSSDAIQEITVTAQRRTENMQNVPIQIQALTGVTLTQLSVTTFDDFVKYLPNVTSASNGPGQGVIFMRGLATSTLATQGSSGIGSFPNVAVYLDDQSGQLPGRNLDVYAADIERIEVLEGPQGTLFGAGAQAGVLRYITNKPKLDVTEGNVNAGYAYTSGGDNSSSVDATINVPLIPDTLAVRAVIYSETRGGYINNLPSTFSRLPSDIGIHYAGYATGCSAGTPTAGQCPTGATVTAYGVPPGSPTVNNNNLVGRAINPVTYQGIRVGALYKFNSDWDALLVQSYQDMDSQGVFYVTPKSSAGDSLPDLGVNLWNPSYNKDKFENTAVTVNGKIGDFKLVYAGSYMVRKVDQQGDYTNYARGVYADYYQCTNPAVETGTTSQCYSPSAYWRESDTATHNSQELRMSTPDDWRLRGIAGLFWEDYTIRENIDWYYKTLPPCTTAADIGCLTNVGPAPGAYVRNPNVRPDNESFFDDVTRGYTQKAAFGSADFDIIPKKLTVTFGTRYYRIDTTASGSSISSFGCYAGGPPPCTGNAPYSNDLSAHNLNVTYSGFKSRANLSFRPWDDVLLYYTWSQGFRPGGFNRGAAFADHSEGSVAGPVNGFAYTFKANQAYAPDSLVNNEIGWKTEWFDRRLEFNGAVYQEDWKDVQVQIFESCCYGNLSFVVNGPNYRVRGLEIESVARPLHGLTVTGAASWNSSNLTNAPFLKQPNGQPIIIPVLPGQNNYGGSPFGTLNSPLAQSPPFQASLRARYEMVLGDYKAFTQIGGTHQAHSYSATGNIQTYDQAGFTTYDASLGAEKDAWVATLYMQNLTDTRANLFENGNQFVTAQTINRPRTGGVRFSYKF
ncbi:MAG TPA: TonB-dependent receptor [Steroidobacteraceae bacterium]|nr:TonB-dependent receptor [Steroidobacteraceae bacterium]